jgi:acyl carrier protein
MESRLTSQPGDRDVAARVHEFILAKLLEGEDPANLTETTPLVSTGIIDSVSSLKVGLFLEKTFSIKVTRDEIANPDSMETIASITKLVLSKLRLRGSGAEHLEEAAADTTPR